jgi:hypothetical protein
MRLITELDEQALVERHERLGRHWGLAEAEQAVRKAREACTDPSHQEALDHALRVIDSLFDKLAQPTPKP